MISEETLKRRSHRRPGAEYVRPHPLLEEEKIQLS